MLLTCILTSYVEFYEINKRIKSAYVSRILTSCVVNLQGPKSARVFVNRS